MAHGATYDGGAEEDWHLWPIATFARVPLTKERKIMFDTLASDLTMAEAFPLVAEMLPTGYHRLQDEKNRLQVKALFKKMYPRVWKVGINDLFEETNAQSNTDIVKTLITKGDSYSLRELYEEGLRAKHLANLNSILAEILKTPGELRAPIVAELSRWNFPLSATKFLSSLNKAKGQDLQDLRQGQCFDWEDYDNRPIETYLNYTPNGIIYSTLDGHAVCSSVENLNFYLKDPTSIFYHCIGRDGRFPVDQKWPVIKLPVADFMTYVPAAQLKRALKQKQNFLLLYPVDVKWETTASKGATEGGGWVSADHCQAGSDKQLWSLIGTKI